MSVVSHSGRFTPVERSPSSPSKADRVCFRVGLNAFEARIEPKFLGWVCVRTVIVYITVAFRNVGNAHKWRQNVFGIYLSYNDGNV